MPNTPRPRIPVTTRIFTLLAWHPINLHEHHCYWEGAAPNPCLIFWLSSYKQRWQHCNGKDLPGLTEKLGKKAWNNEDEKGNFKHKKRKIYPILWWWLWLWLWLWFWCFSTETTNALPKILAIKTCLFAGYMMAWSGYQVKTKAFSGWGITWRTTPLRQVATFIYALSIHSESPAKVISHNVVKGYLSWPKHHLSPTACMCFTS